MSDFQVFLVDVDSLSRIIHHVRKFLGSSMEFHTLDGQRTVPTRCFIILSDSSSKEWLSLRANEVNSAPSFTDNIGKETVKQIKKQGLLLSRKQRRRKRCKEGRPKRRIRCIICFAEGRPSANIPKVMDDLAPTMLLWIMFYRSIFDNKQRDTPVTRFELAWKSWLYCIK